MPKPQLPLPVLMLVTDRRVAGGEDALIQKVAAAVEGGVNVVQLREKDLAHDPLVSLGRRLREVIAGRAVFLVNASAFGASAFVALECGADGVHAAENAAPIKGRPEGLIGGRSVHSLEAARRAEADFVDYVIFGPVYQTESHEGAPAVGLRGLAAVVNGIAIPVIAIGGITATRVPEVLAAGAQGVAVIRAVLAADDPQAAAESLASALGLTGART
jgi:thiamine-phosphate pyrophosphorylase